MCRPGRLHLPLIFCLRPDGTSFYCTLLPRTGNNYFFSFCFPGKVFHSGVENELFIQYVFVSYPFPKPYLLLVNDSNLQVIVNHSSVRFNVVTSGKKEPAKLGEGIHFLNIFDGFELENRCYEVDSTCKHEVLTFQLLPFGDFFSCHSVELNLLTCEDNKNDNISLTHYLLLRFLDVRASTPDLLFYFRRMIFLPSACGFLSSIIIFLDNCPDSRLVKNLKTA